MNLINYHKTGSWLKFKRTNYQAALSLYIDTYSYTLSPLPFPAPLSYYRHSLEPLYPPYYSPPPLPSHSLEPLYPPTPLQSQPHLDVPKAVQPKNSSRTSKGKRKRYWRARAWHQSGSAPLASTTGS